MGLTATRQTVSTSAVTIIHTCAHWAQVLVQPPAAGSVYLGGASTVASTGGHVALTTSNTNTVTVTMVAGDVLYAIGSSSSVVFQTLVMTAG